MIIDRSGRVAKFYRREIAVVQGMYAWQKKWKRTACPFKVSKFGLGRYWIQGWDWMRWTDGQWNDLSKENLLHALENRERFRGWPDEITVS